MKLRHIKRVLQARYTLRMAQGRLAFMRAAPLRYQHPRNLRDLFDQFEEDFGACYLSWRTFIARDPQLSAAALSDLPASFGDVPF